MLRPKSFVADIFAERSMLPHLGAFGIVTRVLSREVCVRDHCPPQKFSVRFVSELLEEFYKPQPTSGCPESGPPGDEDEDEQPFDPSAVPPFGFGFTPSALGSSPAFGPALIISAGNPFGMSGVDVVLPEAAAAGAGDVDIDVLSVDSRPSPKMTAAAARRAEAKAAAKAAAAAAKAAAAAEFELSIPAFARPYRDTHVELLDRDLVTYNLRGTEMSVPGGSWGDRIPAYRLGKTVVENGFQDASIREATIAAWKDVFDQFVIDLRVFRAVRKKQLASDAYWREKKKQEKALAMIAAAMIGDEYAVTTK